MSVIAAAKTEGIRRTLRVGASGALATLELVYGERTGKFRIGGDQLLVDTNAQSRISVQDYQ